jgi:hypothetical protein
MGNGLFLIGRTCSCDVSDQEMVIGVVRSERSCMMSGWGLKLVSSAISYSLHPCLGIGFHSGQGAIKIRYTTLEEGLSTGKDWRSFVSSRLSTQGEMELNGAEGELDGAITGASYLLTGVVRFFVLSIME